MSKEKELVEVIDLDLENVEINDEDFKHIDIEKEGLGMEEDK